VPLAFSPAEELLFVAVEELWVEAGMVELEAEEADPAAVVCSKFSMCIFDTATRDHRIIPQDSKTNDTDRRCCVATRDRSTVKRHVSEQIGTLVATLLVWVAGAGLVAALYADRLRWFVVRAPTFLILENGVGEFALAFVVAEAKGLVDVVA